MKSFVVLYRLTDVWTEIGNSMSMGLCEMFLSSEIESNCMDSSCNFAFYMQHWGIYL